MKRVSHLRPLTFPDFMERLIFGDGPPIGVPYRPFASIRCRLGLHLWNRVWDFTRISEEAVGIRDYRASFSVNLDRPHDYVECARCRKMRG